MKKDEVRIGCVYSAKVSGQVVPVKIVQEKWTGDRHTGWVGTNTETGRSVRIKSAQRLRAQVGASEAEAPKATKLANVAGDVGHGGVPSDPVGTSAVAASPVPPAATSGGRSKKSKKATAGQKAKGAKAPKERKPKTDRPMSCLDAAAKVLRDSGEPMRVKDLIEAMAKKGLWESKNGKTPTATLYAAVIREIHDKGVDSRFEKKSRGLFAAAGK